VGNFFKTFRGHLYKKYPGLSRRTLSGDERKKLTDHGLGKYANVSQVTLLLASEVDEIIDGHDEPYRAKTGKYEASVSDSYVPHTPRTSIIPKEPKSSRVQTPSVLLGPTSNHAYSVHLDPVPEATKINRSKFVKKGRLFPFCFDDLDPNTVHANAAQTEVLVPIRIDLDLEGQKVRDTFTWNKNES